MANFRSFIHFVHLSVLQLSCRTVLAHSYLYGHNTVSNSSCKNILCKGPSKFASYFTDVLMCPYIDASQQIKEYLCEKISGANRGIALNAAATFYSEVSIRCGGA